MILLPIFSASWTPNGDAAILNNYMPQILKAQQDTGVPAWLIGAIIMHESGGKAGAIQPNGLGRGLMQVDGGSHPEAYDPRMTGTSPSDIQYQISTGAQILANDIAANGGDMARGLQAYAGAGNTTFINELQNTYVPAVAAAFVKWGTTKGNFSLANSLKQVPVIPGSIVTAIPGVVSGVQNAAGNLTSPLDTLGNVVGFFSDQNNWLAIAIGVGGFILIVGGLFLAFSSTEAGGNAEKAAVLV